LAVYHFTKHLAQSTSPSRAAPQIIELDTDEGTADLAVATSKDPHALYVEALERDLVA